MQAPERQWEQGRMLADVDRAVAAPDGLLAAWKTRVGVLNNPFLWRLILIVLGVPSLLAGVVVALVARDASMLVLVPPVALAATLAPFVALGGAIDLMGGVRGAFFLTAGGARMVLGPHARAVSMNAEPKHGVFMAWDEVRKVRVNRRQRLIVLRSGPRSLTLFCAPDTFTQVLGVLGRQTTARS